MVVRFLAFRVPHLFIAPKGKDMECLIDLPVAAEDAFLVCERRGCRVVGVLSAHHLRDLKHRAPHFER